MLPCVKLGKKPTGWDNCWLNWDFGKRSTPVTLYAYNQGSIARSNSPKFHGHTKYIDVRFYQICEAVSMKQLNIVNIPTAEMAAGGFTTGLPAPGFSEFRRMIGMSKGS